MKAKTLLILSLLVLSACNDPNKKNTRTSAGDDFTVLIDRGTGCQYLKLYNDRSITPRYDAGGKTVTCSAEDRP